MTTQNATAQHIQASNSVSTLAAKNQSDWINLFTEGEGFVTRLRKINHDYGDYHAVTFSVKVDDDYVKIETTIKADNALNALLNVESQINDKNVRVFAKFNIGDIEPKLYFDNNLNERPYIKGRLINIYSITVKGKQVYANPNSKKQVTDFLTKGFGYLNRLRVINPGESTERVFVSVGGRFGNKAKNKVKTSYFDTEVFEPSLIQLLKAHQDKINSKDDTTTCHFVLKNPKADYYYSDKHDELKPKLEATLSSVSTLWINNEVVFKAEKPADNVAEEAVTSAEAVQQTEAVESVVTESTPNVMTEAAPQAATDFQQPTQIQQ